MPARLNILFVTSWYPSKQEPLYASFVKEHARAAALNNNVTVLSIGGKSTAVKGAFDVSVCIEDNINTIRLTHKVFSVPKITPIISALNTLRYMYKMRREGFRPDIIHANIYTAGIPSVLFGRLTGSKVVVTEHWSGYARDLLNRLEAAKARFAFNNADMILPVSSDLRLNIEKYGINGKFKIVPNVIDTKIFKLGHSEKRNNNSLKRILVVASQIPVKGIPDLLEAIKRVKSTRNDFTLDIIGEGESRTENENLAVSFGIENDVKFHDFQPKTIVAQFMQESDFLILPSRYETFGCVIIEAMACGIPVIASRVGGVKDIVTEKTGKLVEPGNIGDLADSIEFMLDNYGFYSKNDLSDYAKSKFSAEVIGKELNDIYHEVLETE